MEDLLRRNIDWNALFKTADLTPQIQKHLGNVYTTLVATVLAAAIGSITAIVLRMGSGLLFFVGLALAISLNFIPREQVAKRIGVLLGFGFVQGLSLGPFLAQLARIDPSIITSAFLGTVCIFGCFSAAAVFAKRRSYLYLGGFLSSALTIMFFTSLANMFFRSTFAFNAILYLGLLVFCGFVVFDTQLVIERAAVGNTDFVSDALGLFMDFVAIFVRLAIILSKDNKKKNERK
ncbi:putative Bax inhibitor 1 [Planoprotostelium fungivorum]|uniref:Putative Bax inhibitor 1 n=1 Tax=Planoprotostelium fungivorum TaxID=1890364 RepID=A0A2P6MZ04_9EUKA|nr:putative Bax inhibitor 1 [Planoprotostelium fungivorum]